MWFERSLIMDYQDFWSCDEDDYDDVPWYGSEFESLIDISEKFGI